MLRFWKQVVVLLLVAQAGWLGAQTSGQDQSENASAGGGGDYFQGATQGKVIRWSTEKMPLKVAITRGNSVPGFLDSYPDDVKESFQAWSQASQGTVSFQFVEGSPTDADIIVSWTADPAKLQQSSEGAQTKFTASGDLLDQVSIEFLTEGLEAKQSIDDERLKQLSLHEIGHALGLVGHSPFKEDVMHFSSDAEDLNSKITARDVATLKRLYMQVTTQPQSPAAMNLAASSALNSGNLEKAITLFRAAHQSYPDSEAITRNLGTALNNAGLKAMDEDKDYSKATACFDEAMRYSPEDEHVRGNLGLAWFDRGVAAEHASDSKTALDCYKKGLQFLKAADNQELFDDCLRRSRNMLIQLGREDEAEALLSKYKSGRAQ